MARTFAQRLTVCFAVFALWMAPALRAQSAKVTENRIVGPVDDGDAVVLPGNVYPMARPEFDVGPTDLALPMQNMILTLKLAPAERAELDALLARQQDPSSPDFHRWLTPEEFGLRFGPSQHDLDAVTGWLRSQGFTVDAVAKGRTWVDFSGTAADVERAFHTHMHDYRVNGVLRHANADDPSIPRALAPVVAGVVSLNSFPRKAMHTPLREVAAPALQPEYTNGSSHYLAPGDFATIYNSAPLYAAGTDGTGVTIAIVGRTHPSTAATDWSSFRSTFGLPANPPVILVNGADPGDQGSGEDSEADLDVEWAGAAAPGATIDFVCSASTATADGVDLSAQYIVDQNLAPIMSTSFGLCESDLGSAGNDFYNSLWSQAAAQGITAFVSSGDNGASGCDSASASTGTGAAVSGLASTPYDVAVGGTQFLDTANPSSYWGSSNNPSTQASALGYIPEQAWNESGAAATCPQGDTCSGLWATSGGASTLYAKPSWQAAPGVPGDGWRDVPDVSLTAAQHDGYLISMSGHFYVASGTSAASPSFAGLMALVVQNAGGRQGNANARLYQLASAQYGGGGPAVFHDATTGNNTVPGVTGFNCASGYDQATGLGSVDAYVLVNSWGSTGGCPAITLTPAAGRYVLTEGRAASQTFAAGGGTAPYTFSATGELPPGTSLTDAGVFSGTPTTAGTYACTVTATDADACTGSQTYTIVVVAPPLIQLIKKATAPFRFVVTGSNLQKGIQVYINYAAPNPAAWPKVSWKRTTKIVIGGGAALKLAVPKGVPTGFAFVNPDGGVATVDNWQW